MKYSLLFLGVFVHFSALAQIPFAQAIQSPLVLNSSMAGNKHNNRLSAIYNQSQVRDKRITNYHFFFDTFLKKLGSGLGVFYIRQQYKSSAIPSNMRSDANFSNLNANSFNKPGQTHLKKYKKF